MNAPISPREPVKRAKLVTVSIWMVIQALCGFGLLLWPLIGVDTTQPHLGFWYFLLQVPLTVGPALLALAMAGLLFLGANWVRVAAILVELAQLGGLLAWGVLALALRSYASISMIGEAIGLLFAIVLVASAIFGVVRLAGRHGRARWRQPVPVHHG